MTRVNCIVVILAIAAACFANRPQRADAERGESDFNLVSSANESSLAVSDDLEVDLLLQEPTVANPVHVTFDERGRLWVTQYRQYPLPAGLRLLSRDSVWRNVYSPPFAPPPPHAPDSPFRGLDKITIHEDVDHNGTFDKTTTFVEGLNLATASLPGRGGVFVLNPPYLLFYADRDGDDVPDSQTPEILLSGFGFEDSHALANSLRWGPDGWIYATQGSTVSSAVVTYDKDGKPIEDRPVVRSMGQNVWRYDPDRRIYEIYAEGGGNAFGIEIDKKGRVFSGHNGGDTRGFHYVQGGYYQKTFGKHGQLSNPYAFDYLRPMGANPSERFTHTFCLYEASALPARYHGVMFSLNPLGHQVVLSEVSSDRSSWQTQDIGFAVRSGSEERSHWFIPVDAQIGPDGAIYLADWYAMQANHYRNHEGQTNPDLGRVYRLRGHEYRPVGPIDFAEATSDELVDELLASDNRWRRQTALRLLADRRDKIVIPRLWSLVQRESGQTALEAFWALHASGGLTRDRLAMGLTHDDPHVRRWALHLLGDEPAWASSLGSRLQQLAQEEPHPETRCQLAATLRRLPAEVAVPVIFDMLQRTGDAADIFIPGMLWWALEAHAGRPDAIFRELADSARWSRDFTFGGETIPQNLMRRFALTGKQADLGRCAQLLKLAPNADWRDDLVEAFATAYAGRTLPQLPDALAGELSKSHGVFAQLTAIRRNDMAAITEGIASLTAAGGSDDVRIATIQALADVRADPAVMLPALNALLSGDAAEPVKGAVLLALQRYPGPEIGSQILATWDQLPPGARETAVQVLASRRDWADDLLMAFDAGQIDKYYLDGELAARLRRFPDASIQQSLDKLASVPHASISELEAKIEELAMMVKEEEGSPLEGRKLFHGKMSCGKCHRLFDQGEDIGPDLTSYNRSDVARMLLALVNPNAEIREGFEVYTVLTTDGLMLQGFKVDENDQVLVIRGSDGSTQTIAKKDIDEVIPNTASIMPEGLLDTATEDEIRDLFAFLLSTTPPM